MRVAFLTLYLSKKPYPQFQKSLEACLPAIEALGWEHKLAVEEGCPYISAARTKVLSKALDFNPDCVVYLDYDISWTPESMVKLLETEGDVVAGTYRTKRHDEKYMGEMMSNAEGLIVREDGCIRAAKVPAGFLKISRRALDHFAKHYPHLLLGSPLRPELDLFNHGVIDGVWFGEDYAFSKRWNDIKGEIWVVPDLDICHHKGEDAFPGNFHNYLMNYNKPQPILSNPLVSIIIPCYNYANYVGEAIESALAQTYKNIEVLVVDDGSTDESYSVAAKYPVTVISQPNKGVAAARNTGVREAKGEWVMQLDADDKLCSTYVEECLKVADADIISTAQRNFGDDTSVINIPDTVTYYGLSQLNRIHVGSMYRRSLWEESGGYDEYFRDGYEDWEFWINVMKRGAVVSSVPKALYNYRKHGPSMIDRCIERHYELYDYIKQKHNIP